LWPHAAVDHSAQIERYFSGSVPGLEIVLLALMDAEPAGFAELSIRAYAEGCATENVGYLEGWYVAPAYRHLGVGRALVRAAEEWARGRGCRELASDTEPENELSREAHLGCGFEDVALVRCFRKVL
jgi:aminoglycoside 6'-N-acetyltransferase I